MYARRCRVYGEANHVVGRRTLPLTDGQADLVRIVETNGSGLQGYRMTDYGLTWRQLRSYMSDHPSRSITYERAGTRVELERATDDPGLVEPVPEWRREVPPFRAVDMTSPERCVPPLRPPTLARRPRITDRKTPGGG